MLPLIISALLFINWLLLPAKKWNPQIVCFFLLLGEMLLNIPLAENNFAAFWTTYGLVVIFLFICIPLIHFVNSVRKVTILVNTYLLVFLYVGLFAIFHGGMGPAMNWGGQDENYTSAMMCMAIPLAYFSLYIAKDGLKKKLSLLFTLGVYVLAVVVGLSRGGFVGVVVVFLYCLFKSPKKWTGIALGAVAVTLLLTLTSDQYWQEMNTITDTNEATADLRLEAWTIAFRMFQDHPVFGVGPGNFVWNAPAYQSAEQFEKFGRSLFLLTHSVFFEILAELGLVGIGLFGAVLYYNCKDLKFVTRELQKRREDLREETKQRGEEYQALCNDCERIRYYGYGLMGSMLGFLAPFAFVAGAYQSYFWIITAMIVALKEAAVGRLDRYKRVEILSAAQEPVRSAVLW
jgi:O-antigen ligase